MQVTYKNHMGDDIMVANAARVSFAKESQYDIFVDPWNTIQHALPQTDVKLIKYLAKHKHWSPFGHPQIQLHIKVPIFIARQLDKHQVGLIKNEVSRRYVDSDPEFYIPTEWRGKSKDKKQGSSDEIIKVDNFYLEMPSNDSPDVAEWVPIWEAIADKYKTLIEIGVCPEQARMILPQNTYTEYYWTGSLYAFFRIWSLRSKPDAQKEIQEIARQIDDIIAPLYPVSWNALKEADNGNF